MNLLAAALVFVLIGLVSSNRDPFEDINKQLNNQLNNQFDQLSPNMKAQLANAHLNFGPNNGNDVFVRPQMNPHSEYTPQVQQAIEAIQKKCKEAGKEAIGIGLEAKLKIAIQCVTSRVNPEALKQEFAEAGRTGTIDEVFKKICGLWPDVHNCVKPVLSEAKQCVDRDDQITIDKSVGLVDDSNTYFCENNQERMKKIVMEGGIQCIQTVGREVGQCAQSFGQAMKNREEKGAIPVAYDAQGCSDFKTMRSCISGELGKCQNQNANDVIDGYLGVVQKAVCNSASTLSWFSTFNLFLVLCTFLYSKMF